jgi:hypothetical protein
MIRTADAEAPRMQCLCVHVYQDGRTENSTKVREGSTDSSILR